MTPDITHSGGTAQPPFNTAQNFNSPVTYTVTDADGAVSIWTVTVRLEPLAPDANIGDYIANYISTHSGTGTAANPVPLPLAIDLSTGWADLLSAIKLQGKYVAPDGLYHGRHGV
jgi:hypothetical protein